MLIAVSISTAMDDLGWPFYASRAISEVAELLVRLLDVLGVVLSLLPRIFSVFFVSCRWISLNGTQPKAVMLPRV